MNKVFAARVPEGNTGLSEAGDGSTLSLMGARARHHSVPRQSAQGAVR